MSGITALDSAIGRIDSEELYNLATTLGGIYGPYGHEKEAAEYVFNWMNSNGFRPKKIALYEDRPNILGIYPGDGTGPSLIFNSHLDTSVAKDQTLSVENPQSQVHQGAYRKDGKLYGYGVVNDRGPMAAFLIAVKAIKEAGVKLQGDVLLSAVVGEIGQEPVDEFKPPEYISKEAGARYLITHGGIADYAFVAEATDFAITGLMAGKLFLKLTVFGDPGVYTPILKKRTKIEESPNAIVRASRVIEAVEEWAAIYEETNVYESTQGTLIPKASVGAIRGGVPYHIISSSEICSLYIDVRLPPNKNPNLIKRELETHLRSAVPSIRFELTPFVYRRGYEAQGASKLVEAIEKAHIRFAGEKPRRAKSEVCSMWRDTIPFNECGIPAVTYGPNRRLAGEGDSYFTGKQSGRDASYFTENDLLLFCRVCTATCLDVCLPK